ncbi:hypothetical protein GL279_00025 [Paracoccus limosus]|jgi:hypothetical protein|uniref:Uncharacterized protein n=1 Tax=Paracoccus limosus TaxID=913252 RepID=A0A844H0B6_9RHOB|nr:hypothetical protein [Paracoccus limosus]MTH32984.1 hypothetical protein [Paracoccus limosus]
MTVLDKLRAARRAIQQFEPAEATALLQQFEAGFSQERLDPVQARLVEAELQAIAILAEAARDGVAQAQQQVRQLVALSQSLGTYDKSGMRQVQQTAQRPVRKF